MEGRQREALGGKSELKLTLGKKFRSRHGEKRSTKVPGNAGVYSEETDFHAGTMKRRFMKILQCSNQSILLQRTSLMIPNPTSSETLTLNE